MEQKHNRARGRPLTLFIGGLSPETSIEDIERWASGLGCGYSIDFEAKKAWAFVCLDSAAAAEHVLARPHFIRGRKVDCQLAADKDAKASNSITSKRKRVFVNKLPHAAQEGDLQQALSVHGELRNVYIVSGKSNDMTLCYAEYLHGNHAKKAIKLGITYNGRRCRVYKYRTLEELQKKYELRLDRANEEIPQSQTRPGIEVYSSMEHLDRIVRSKNDNQEEFDLPHVKPTSANSKHHFNKPSSKAFFAARSNSNTTYLSNNPLFRIKTEVDNKIEYQRFQVNGTILYLNLQQLMAPSQVGLGEGTKGSSEYRQAYYSRHKQVEGTEYKHNL